MGYRSETIAGAIGRIKLENRDKWQVLRFIDAPHSTLTRTTEERYRSYAEIAQQRRWKCALERPN